MTKIEINEGNTLIADFMGFQYDRKDILTGRSILTIEDCRYHSSWDWLMDVVEKIYKDRNVKDVVISPGRTRIWFSSELKKGFINNPCLPENSSIEECWMAVVEFIKWYNSRES